MPDLLGSKGRAAARIYAEHHSLDVVVLGKVENLGHHLFGSDTGDAGVGDVSYGVEYGYLVVVALLVRDSGVDQI